MGVIGSTRFWACLAIIAAATVALCLGKLTSGEWTGLVGGLLGGFGVAKATPGSATSSDAVTKAAIPLLLVGALLSGCVCSTPRACLATAQTASAMADKLALDLIGAKCMAEAKKCGPVTGAKCPGWAACDKARTAYKTAINGIDGSLAVCNRVLADLGVK